jgi:hypothetical protein
MSTIPKCPQCKAEIKLSRSRDIIVDAAMGIDRWKSTVVTPGVLAMLSMGLQSMSTAWGIHSIYAVFGAEDGHRILRPILYNTIRAPVEVYANSPRDASRVMTDLILDRLVHWRLYVGLPLIGPVLILSRMTIADSVLPILPILFFATQNYAPNDPVDFATWPPSASLSFAVLPYLRAMYNAYYQKFWAEKEKRWLRELQPRAGQNANEATGGNDHEGGNAAPQGGAGIEVEVQVDEIQFDGGIFGNWEVAIEEVAAFEPQELPNGNARAGNGPAAPAPAVPDNRARADADRLVEQLEGAEENLQRPAAAPQQEPQSQDTLSERSCSRPSLASLENA